MTSVPQFDQYRREVQWHVPHERQKEMSTKSVVVSPIDSYRLLLYLYTINFAYNYNVYAS